MKKIKLKKIHYKLLLLSLTLTFMLILTTNILLYMTPESTEVSHVTNVVETTLNYDFIAEMKASTLYPDGGQVLVEQVLLNKITDACYIKPTYTITSDEPIDLSAEITYDVYLISEERWHKKLISTEVIKKQETIEGTKVFKEAIPIDLVEIEKMVDVIEEETEVAVSNYIIRVIPSINTQLKYMDESEDIEETFNYDIEYSTRVSKLPEETVFSKSKSYRQIEELPYNKNYFYTASYAEAKKRGRILFIGNIIILLFLIGLVIKKGIFKSEEWQKANKLLKSVLLTLDDDIDTSSYQLIQIHEAKKLQKIAQSRDLEILHFYFEPNFQDTYYVLDDRIAYKMMIQRKIRHSD